MRLHTDTLTAHQIHAAVTGLDGVYVELTTHGSRRRARAFDVRLFADGRTGRRRSNNGTSGVSYDFAATWDEWGIFFARLFAIDPDMTCYVYNGAQDYHWQTGDRFLTGNFTPHDQHRWVFVQNASSPMTSPADGVYVYECTCGAVKRWRAPNRQKVST